jgi:hypothetical protein
MKEILVRSSTGRLVKEERFAMLVKDGYKGSGDYGVFAFGVQWSNLNRTEGNRNTW